MGWCNWDECGMMMTMALMGLMVVVDCSVVHDGSVAVGVGVVGRLVVDVDTIVAVIVAVVDGSFAADSVVVD